MITYLLLLGFAAGETLKSMHRRVGSPSSLLFYGAAAVVLCSARPCVAESRITVQLFGGGAWNASTPLTISQEGQADVEISARWETKPFVQPFYWAVRVSLEQRTGAWELQLIHDKLYLADPPREVGSFEITHGFNLVTLNRSFPLGGGFSGRAGLGLVVAHPESTVRGEYDGGGYGLTGPVFLAGAGWQLPLSRYLFVSAEAVVTAAYASVPVARGTASLWNVALHGLVGIGVRFGGPLP